MGEWLQYVLHAQSKKHNVDLKGYIFPTYL